jgi:hypothetical protein
VEVCAAGPSLRPGGGCERKTRPHIQNSSEAQIPANPYDIPETKDPALSLKRPWRRSIYFFGTLVILAAGLLGWHLTRTGPPGAAPAVHGWIHTDGTSLIDASGKKVILAGVDDSRLDAGEGNRPDHCDLIWSPASAADIANMRSMGFNMDRIGVSWANLEPAPPTVNANGTLTHHWNKRYLAALDREIKDLHANHMAAILDMHDAGWSPAFTGHPGQCEGHGLPRWLYNGWLYITAQNNADALGVARCQFFSDTKEAGMPERPQEGFAAVWKMLARRYAANPTVIGADMFNEPIWPTACLDANLRSFYQKVGHAIRMVNTRILLICEDSGYAAKPTGAFLLRRMPALNNALYSWHFYPASWKDGRAALAAHLALARSWNVPLWIGEFDAFGGSYNIAIKPQVDPRWHSDLSALMKYFKDNRISWTIWDYDYGGYSVVVPGTTRPKRGLMSLLRQDMS